MQRAAVNKPRRNIYSYSWAVPRPTPATRVRAVLNHGWRGTYAEGHARRLGGGARAAVLGLSRQENRGLDVTPRPGADLGVTKSVCCVFKIASKRLASYMQLNPTARRL
jgi:hypothetical protein